MEIPRLTRLLQLRYPYALTSLIDGLRGVMLYVNLEQLCRDVLRLNSYVWSGSVDQARHRAMQALFQLYDKFRPAVLILYTNDVVVPERYTKAYLQERYERHFYAEQKIPRSAPIGTTDLAPKSIFMRQTAQFLLAELQPLLIDQQLSSVHFYEDFDVLHHLDQLPSQQMCYVYGLAQNHKLQILHRGMPVKYIFEQQEIFDKPVLDVTATHVDFMQYGVVIYDLRALRECVLCDLLYEQLNDRQKLTVLATHLGFSYQAAAASLHQLRKHVLTHEEMNKVMTDFVVLVLLSGNDWMPEMPGQTFKNGVLDQFIDLYRLTSISDYPFRYLYAADDYQLQIPLLVDFLKVLIKFEGLWAISDVKDVIKMHKIITDESLMSRTASAYLLALEQFVAKEEWARLQAVHPSKQAQEKGFPSFLRQYRNMYYRKISLNEPSLMGEKLVDLESVAPGREDVMALYDCYLNLKSQGSAELAEVEKLLYGAELPDTVKASINLARAYLEAFQQLVSGIICNTFAPTYYKYRFAPCASSLYTYCSLAKADSSNARIADLLWNYHGPDFCRQPVSGDKFYFGLCKAMLPYFSSKHAQEKLIIEQFRAIHSQSPFICRDQRVSDTTFNFSILNYNFYQFTNFGFQVVAFDDRSFVTGFSEYDFQNGDDLFVSKAFSPTRLIFTAYPANIQDVQFVYESVDDQAVQMGEGVCCCLLQHSYPLYKGKLSGIKHKFVLKKDQAVELQASRGLCVLTPNVGYVVKEQGKFNIICKNYQSPTLVFEVQADNVWDDAAKLFYHPLQKSERINYSALPVDACEAIYRQFGSLDLVFSGGSIFSAVDIVGKLYGICHDNRLFLLEDKQLVERTAETTSKATSNLLQVLQEQAALYFYKNKGYSSQGDTILLVSRMYGTPHGVDFLHGHKPHFDDPFISACSIYDTLSVLPVPLELFDRDNEDKVANHLVLRGYAMLFADKTQLLDHLKQLRFADFNTECGLLKLKMDEQTLDDVASKIVDRAGLLVPAELIAELQQTAYVISQVDYEYMPPDALRDYPWHLDGEAQWEYVEAQLGMRLTALQRSSIMGTINVNCTDNAARQFGLAARRANLIDKSLVVGTGLTYRGAVLLIIFAKAFPRLFYALLRADDKQSVEQRDVAQTQTSDAAILCPASVELNKIFPLLALEEVPDKATLAKMITVASWWFFGLPVVRRLSCTSEDSAPGSLIEFLKKIAIRHRTNEFAISIYAPQALLARAELLQPIVVEDMGAGAVVSSSADRIVVVVDGYERTIWRGGLKVWALQDPFYREPAQHVFRDFISCNQLSRTDGPLDCWLGTHFEIDF